jgi:hypothetical protein
VKSDSSKSGYPGIVNRGGQCTVYDPIAMPATRPTMASWPGCFLHWQHQTNSKPRPQKRFEAYLRVFESAFFLGHQKNHFNQTVAGHFPNLIIPV